MKQISTKHVSQKLRMSNLIMTGRLSRNKNLEVIKNEVLTKVKGMNTVIKIRLVKTFRSHNIGKPV